MLWIQNFYTLLICFKSIIVVFPFYVPQWKVPMNQFSYPLPSSTWHPSDWVYNYGNPEAHSYFGRHYKPDHDHNQDHHHVSQQQIIIQDSAPASITAKESFHDYDGNVVQDLITQITTSGEDEEEPSATGSNVHKIELSETHTGAHKIKRSQPNYKRNKSNKSKNLKKSKRKSSKRSKTRKSSSSKRKSNQRKQLSRNRICPNRSSCRSNQRFRNQPFRRRPFDYDYYNFLPFRFNKYRQRNPLYSNEDLYSDYYDYVETFDRRRNPARQEITTETTESTTETTTTAMNITGYGYGPSNGNEHVSFTTIIPPSNSYSHYVPPANDHFSLVSHQGPNKLTFSVSDDDIFARSLSQQVVTKV